MALLVFDGMIAVFSALFAVAMCIFPPRRYLKPWLSQQVRSGNTNAGPGAAGKRRQRRGMHPEPSDHDPGVVGLRPAPQPHRDVLAPSFFGFEEAKASPNVFSDPCPPYSERERDRRT
ncbi:hypothetical protein V8D89_008679 [Ganoderma adspersum]